MKENNLCQLAYKKVEPGHDQFELCTNGFLQLVCGGEEAFHLIHGGWIGYRNDGSVGWTIRPFPRVPDGNTLMLIHRMRDGRDPLQDP